MVEPHPVSRASRDGRRLPWMMAGLVALGGCAGIKPGVSADSGGSATGGSAGQTRSGSGGQAASSLPPPSESSDAAETSLVVGCDGGDGCSCPPLNVAVLGKPGQWGGADDSALQNWLTSSSAGTARVDNFTDRVTLTSDFLATYNVIILQSLSDDSSVGPWWTYSDAEVAAFQSWIENGGGVISLSGYSSSIETGPDNQLIGFSGITYNNDGVWGDCVDSTICTCTGSETLSNWNQTDPVIAGLITGVTLVGWENGHSINAPADGHVAATMSGANVLVGKLVGAGHVLAYGDEWITYTSQWTGAGNPNASSASCQGELPQDKYQIAQLWYNMIHWSQPDATCFKIVNTLMPIIIW